MFYDLPRNCTISYTFGYVTGWSAHTYWVVPQYCAHAVQVGVVPHAAWRESKTTKISSRVSGGVFTKVCTHTTV